MQQTFTAKIKFFDRQFKIRKPIAYLGRSGCEYSGQFQTKLEQLKKEDFNTLVDQQFIQFLPIGDGSNIDVVSARISYDCLRELGNNKIVAENFELNPNITNANYVLLEHNSTILIDKEPCVFQYGDGIKKLERLLKNKEEIQKEKNQEKKKKKNKKNEQEQATAIKSSNLINLNIIPIDIDNLINQQEEEKKIQKKVTTNNKTLKNYLQFIKKEKPKIANPKGLKRIQKNMLKKEKNIGKTVKKGFYKQIQDGNSTSLFNILEMINQIDIKYQAPKEVKFIDTNHPTTGIKRRGRPKKAIVDESANKAQVVGQKKQIFTTTEVKKPKKI